MIGSFFLCYIYILTIVNFVVDFFDLGMTTSYMDPLNKWTRQTSGGSFGNKIFENCIHVVKKLSRIFQHIIIQIGIIPFFSLP
jgi:uncharacterized protein YggT (Ycf19 family)